ncbi:MAG: hypothetical protein ABIS86_06215 [Streptosporangiaceae bacterium]
MMRRKRLVLLAVTVGIVLLFVERACTGAMPASAQPRASEHGRWP